MGSRFSVLRPQPTSILPTATSHHSRSNSHSHSHHSPSPTNPSSPRHDFFSPSLSSLLGPTLPLDSPYWSTSLLDLCQSLSVLSGVTSAEVEAVLSRSCRAMYTATVVQQHRNLHHLMLLVAYHTELIVQTAIVPSMTADSSQQLSLDAVLNLLFLCRTFLGYIIEHSTAEQLLICFAHTSPPFPLSPSPLASLPPLPVSAVFVSSLFSVLYHVPVTATTYDFHLESLHTLLTLFSTQLYHSSASLQPHAHPFVSAALILPSLPLPSSPQPPDVMSALLARYTDEVCAHFERPSASAAADSGSERTGRRSLLLSLRSGLSSILLLPYHIFRYFFPPPPLPYPLADRALLCFLLLAHQQHVTAAVNGYRVVLSQLCDADEEGVVVAGGASVSFDAVYSALLYTLPSRSSVLLLFTLLHLAPSFLAYVYAKTEIELLMLPLLHSLYKHIRSLDSSNNSSTTTTTSSSSSSAAPATTSTAQAADSEPKDVYMLLIILLLLSSDSSFVLQSHRQMLSRVPWHTDYPLHNISLASFISLLLLRLLSAQLSGRATARDSYVVSNVLAILANVSRESRAVHTAVARRMASVLEVLVKRWKRVKKRERMVAVVRDRRDGEMNEAVETEAREVLAVLGQYLSVLCVYAHPSHMHENIPLLYALMHDKRHLSLLADETRQAVDQRVTYLLGLIAHFELVVDVYNRQHKKSALPLQLIAPSQPVPALPTAASAPSAATSGSSDLDPLLSALAADASHWRLTLPSSSLGAYIVEGECFQYVEEEGSYEFIVPYVWEVGRDEGGWKHGWGGGRGSGGDEEDGVESEDENGRAHDSNEDDGLLSGEGVRTNGTVKPVSVIAV